MTRAVVLAVLVAGCSSADEHLEPIADVAPPPASASTVPVLPIASESASAAPVVDVAVREGETRLEGVYGQEPQDDRHKFQGTFLTLDDGSRVIMSYGVRPERAALLGKRVIVVGKVYTPDGRMTRTVGGKHVDPRVVVASP